MPAFEPISSRFVRVLTAFESDGFAVKRFTDPGDPGAPAGYRMKDGFMGVLAEHTRARNRRTGRPKRAFYVEGDAWHRGYLLGLMAEDDVSRMTGDFLKKVVFSFFDSSAARTRGIFEEVQELIVRIASEATRKILPDVPPEYLEEIQGILDGCAASNPRTTVTRDELFTLNFGFDAILAHVYSGEIFAKKRISPRLLRTPLGCNAFALTGKAAGGKVFFGRDFMFPTADVFQDVACIVICHPDAAGSHAFASQAAPGFVGSMAAMNAAGLAMGVNMLSTRLCSPERPGFNSLGLVRDCAQHCGSAEEAVARIAAAPRGVTWLYPVADATGEAFVVEAGRRLGPRERFPALAYVPWRYRRRLPTRGYIRRMRRRYGTPRPREGMIVRSRSYRYPEDFIIDWNERLYRAFDRDWFAKTVDFLSDLVGLVVGLLSGRFRSLWPTLKKEVEELHRGAAYAEADFSERGFINTTWTDRNCPGPFYFAPQREARTDLILATNHAVSPEMRMTAMNEWIALLAEGNTNDIQWRYDELNREILDSLDASPGGISEETAWDLANFLRPNGRFPAYYNPGASRPGEDIRPWEDVRPREDIRPWEDVQVHGSVTLCELTERVMKCLYGYYGDEPVTVHLGRYVNGKRAG